MWLRGPAAAQELKILAAGGDRDDEALIQAPTDLSGELWLTLDCRAKGADWYELRHSADSDKGPLSDLVKLRDPEARLIPPQLIRCAESFATQWGLPLLPDGWHHSSRIPPRPVFCYPLAELGRSAVLADTLSRMLVARWGGGSGPLRSWVASVRAIPEAHLLPLIGKWGKAIPVRGKESVAVLYELAEHQMPLIDWPPEYLMQPVPSHVPTALEVDPFLPLRCINQDPAKSISDQSLVFLRAACDWVATGIKVYVHKHPMSLLAFMLEEWAHQYTRRGGQAYCSHISESGAECGRPLPSYAPTNRKYCDAHRKSRRRKRKREWAATHRRRDRSRARRNPDDSVQGKQPGRKNSA